MIPQKQLNRHRPDEGVYGDCWRTAIACLMDVKPEEVPHFNGPSATGDEQRKLIDEWLSWHQLRQFEVGFVHQPHFGLEELLAHTAKRWPELHFLLGGRSRNGTDHLVVCRDGAIVHDPAIDESGIVGPQSDGHWWIIVLVRTT